MGNIVWSGEQSWNMRKILSITAVEIAKTVWNLSKNRKITAERRTIMKIKATEKFTDLAFKTTATLMQERYSIEDAVRIGERIEAIGQLFVGEEYDNNYQIIRFDAPYDVIVDIRVKFKNGTMTAVNCTVIDYERPVVIFPSLKC